MRVVDTAVFEKLEDNGFWVPVLHQEEDPAPVQPEDTIVVHDSLVTVDAEGQTVVYAMPYIVYHSSVGDDDNRRLSGRHGRRSVFFSFMYVGVDRNQAKWAGEKLRGVLQDKRVTVPGHRTWLCGLDESQRIRRDDDAIRTDGSPVFYGVDNYALSITLTH